MPSVRPVQETPFAPRGRGAAFGLALVLVLPALSGGCDDNDTTNNIIVVPDPLPGPADDLPGVVVEITAVRGGTGPQGNLRAGDVPTVEFTLHREDGQPLELEQMNRGVIMISGPTFNYHRVIASQSNVIDSGMRVEAGRYTYRFAMPIPAAYLAPLNDTGDITDGELTGQPLLSGTYTVGIEMRKDYTIEGATFGDVGNATRDFLLGSATAIEPREVVTLANCNQCHGELRAHGGNRNNVNNCLLCHTTGAEDRNVAAAAGGTPGVSIDFKVMIHKLHAGRTLPSVQGVTTNMDGSRDYDAAPRPYQLVGHNDSVHDFSDVHFPVWPAMNIGMPRDAGYSGLSGPHRAKEDAMLTGPVACAKCHGDPDGSGPLPAPAQGDLIYSQPTRNACGSCHDDWVWDRPYRANDSVMPPQRDNAACTQCHRPSGGPLDVMDAHRHPLTDPARAGGVRVEITSVTDAGGDNDGTFDPGERVALEFTVQDDDGNPLPPASLGRIEAVLQGPTVNPSLLHFIRIATAGVGSGPVHTIDLPQNIVLEYVGDSDGNLNQFATAQGGHWNVSGAATYVFVQTATGAATMLAADVAAGQNFVDVMSANGFAAGNYVALGTGPGREFVRVRHVEGTRLWLSSPNNATYGSGAAARPIAAGTRQNHAPGTAVTQVTLAEVPTGSYTLDPVTGIVEETTEFGAGPVLVTYTADWLVPRQFPVTVNASPDLDASWGDWSLMPVLDGTYTLGLYATRSFTVTVQGESTSYTQSSPPETVQLLFGSATEPVTVARIDGPQGCYDCHDDIQFHGSNRRGVDTCLLCHGVAGGEDGPRYVWPGGAATPGVTIDFRTMLHKIHHGRELADGANYAVAGFNGTPHTYETVGFPHMPGGTADCAACHGADNQAWREPTPRDHPAAPVPTRSWRAACGACHDTSAAQAHIDINTSAQGAEACAICHGPGKDEQVETVHRSR